MLNKKILLIASLMLSIVLGVIFKLQVDLTVKSREEVDVRYLPSPALASVLSFGFKDALADIYWIQGINYFGEQLQNKRRSYQYLKAYVDLILKLDPLFEQFYNWAATAFVYNGLPSITRENVINSIRYANLGIINLHEKHRYDRDILVKPGFNYAIETENRVASIPYFKWAALSFPEDRNLLLVASAYAHAHGDQVLAADLKLEFFGQIAFEAERKEDIVYALRVATSPRMNIQAAEFVRALRVKMETDEETRKLVASQLEQKSFNLTAKSNISPLPADPRIENILNVDISRTWLKPEMLLLFSL
jgi:hypothetical protein